MRKIILFLLMLIPFVSFGQVRIQMEKEGGVFKVPCEVNGAKMKMVFDTGASSVSLSQSMYDYLLENDYINSSDSKGYVNSIDANGKRTRCLLVNIHTLKIAGKVVHDLTASVSPYQNAPLLLGLTAIQKFGKVTVEGNNLVIGTEEAEGDVVPTSVLGCKFGDTRSNIRAYLRNSYSDYNFWNDKDFDYVSSVRMYGVILDAIFRFDKNDRLISVRLYNNYKSNELSLVKSNRDLLAKYYKNKYHDMVSQIADDGFRFYLCGGTYYLETTNEYYWSVSIGCMKNADNEGYFLYIDYFGARYMSQESDI